MRRSMQFLHAISDRCVPGVCILPRWVSGLDHAELCHFTAKFNQKGVQTTGDLQVGCCYCYFPPRPRDNCISLLEALCWFRRAQVTPMAHPQNFLQQSPAIFAFPLTVESLSTQRQGVQVTSGFHACVVVVDLRPCMTVAVGAGTRQMLPRVIYYEPDALNNGNLYIWTPPAIVCALADMIGSPEIEVCIGVQELLDDQHCVAHCETFLYAISQGQIPQGNSVYATFKRITSSGRLWRELSQHPRARTVADRIAEIRGLASSAYWMGSVPPTGSSSIPQPLPRTTYHMKVAPHIRHAWLENLHAVSGVNIIIPNGNASTLFQACPSGDNLAVIVSRDTAMA